MKVRSFKEIMEEKRLRKQQSSQPSRLSVRGKISSKPIESYLRRTSSDSKSKTFENPSSRQSNCESLIDTTKSNSSKGTAGPVRNLEENQSRPEHTILSDKVTASITPTTAPIKLKRLSSTDGDVPDGRKSPEVSNSQSDIISSNASSEKISQPSMEDIQKAL